MTHTFLLRPGSWSAQGRYFDARYRLQTVRGELVVRHEPLHWFVAGALELAESGQRLNLACMVAPSNGGAAATWSCALPGLGDLEGSWELAGRRMFSSYRSRDGAHAGQATFTRQGETAYLAEGELRRADAIVCSWALTLRPQATGA